jgi:hypothetical protein
MSAVVYSIRAAAKNIITVTAKIDKLADLGDAAGILYKKTVAG